MPHALEIRSSLVLTSEFRRFAVRPFFTTLLTLWETQRFIFLMTRRKTFVTYPNRFIVGLFTLPCIYFTARRAVIWSTFQP